MTQSDPTTISEVWNTQAPHVTALEAACRFQCSVIPLDADKRPCKVGGVHKDGTPKRLAWKKYQTEYPHEKQINHWQRTLAPSAWAIVTGAISHIIIIDFDGKQGEETRRKLGLPSHVKTGSGGSHTYFQHPGWHVPTLNSKSKKEMGQRWPGLDIRADGGYAAFCGCNEQGLYTWQRDFQPEPLDILPDELRLFLGLMYSPDEVKARQERATRSTRVEPDKLLKWAIDRLSNVGRNDGGFDLACQLRDNNFSESEAAPIMFEYARRVSPMNTKGLFEPYTDTEALASLKSAYAGIARQPWEVTLPPEQIHYSTPPQNGNGNNGNGSKPAPPSAEDPHRCGLTDLGNAERFYDRYKDTVRWCETWNTWLVFNGKCWEADKSGRVDQFAKVVVRAIYYEAAAKKAAGETEDGEKVWKHAKASESNRAIRALLDRAKSELPITPDRFNAHLHLLNCNNGTLDLRTGELRPHNPQDFLTRCIKVNYNPLAPCSGWETFIQTIFSNDKDLITFIQQSSGMSLSGDISEQCLFICHGEGSNGKTTMIEIIRKIMQDYGLAANIETFQMRKNEAIRNDIAELYGARFVSASENVIGSRLNEAFIKKATGGEPLRARRLHENEFEFMPEFTIWIAVNHKPVVKDTTKGMWRRVHFIPFLVTFDEQAADKHFGKKLLAAESEGILAWLVKGCMTWYQQGRLTVPETVRKATQAYRAEMDIVANFLETECDLKAGYVKSKQLTERYESWCKQNSEFFDAKDLKRGLNERGFHSQRGTGGVYVYHGIVLKSVDDPTPPSTTEDSERSEGSEPKKQVSPRGTETSQKISDLHSPTFTTFTHERENTQSSEGTFTNSPLPYDSEYYLDMESWLVKSSKPRPPKPCSECHTDAWWPYWQRGERTWGCATCNPSIANHK